MRHDFSAKTINTLSRRAGFRCSNPDCRKLTVGSHESRDKSTLVGVAAHITAAAEGGPRYNSGISPEERSAIENGIWLCSNCSTLIDKDADKFSDALLNQWREGVEKETADELRVGSQMKPKKIESKKESFTEKAEKIKEQRKKQMDVDTFLRSPQAMEVAREQVGIIMERLKSAKATLEDPTTGIHFGTFGRTNDMYGFGLGDKYICFNWSRPKEYDVANTRLIVSLLERTGVWEFDLREVTVKRNEYRYSRDLDGTDGWIDLLNGEGFISTEDLLENWINDFVEYIGQ